jgi:lipocalin-like protein
MGAYRLRSRPSVLALVAVASLCSARAAEAGDLKRADVVGTWRLVSVETLRPNGEVSHEWMGRNPLGLIIYDATGLMAVQIMRDPRPTFAPGRGCCIPERTATPEEIGAAYEGYYAYFGGYEVDEREGAVVHRVQGSLWPREVGRDYKRRAEVSGDRLTLTTPHFQWAGEQRANRLTWERVR